MAQLDSFRVRKFALRIADLPHYLDGMTIAQVSDIHVGRFAAELTACGKAGASTPS